MHTRKTSLPLPESGETTPFTAESRAHNLRRLENEPFDVLIAGGGINGAGIARDLTLRASRARWPLRVALVEQRQFASGTSGKSSQLIHGGLRYLKQMEFGLVRQALRERFILLKLAPHLIRPLPFLIPMHGWQDHLLYGAGLRLYDWLAGKRNISRARFLSREQVRRLEPGLAAEELTGAGVFFDCLVHASRFVLENIWDAARHGAVIVNYTRAERSPNGRLTVTDTLSGMTFPVRAKKLVDATGPWEAVPELRLVRGSHIILPRLNSSDNAIAYFEESGRIVFVIPWGTSRPLSLVGTTEQDHDGSPDDVRISAEEISYLLGIVRRLFPSAQDLRPIAAYSSLRPLVGRGTKSPTTTSREHRIWNSDAGVLHVAGGKYTTYRVMSQEAADLVAAEIAPELRGLHVTAETPLGANTKAVIEDLLTRAPQMAELEAGEVESVVREYGVQTAGLLSCLAERDGDGLSRLEGARIAFAVNHEMAQRLPDLMFVSTYWGYEKRWTAENLEPFARRMGQHLGWDSRRTGEEIELVLRIAAV